jgi:hypothetical protein
MIYKHIEHWINHLQFVHPALVSIGDHSLAYRWLTQISMLFVYVRDVVMSVMIFLI